MRRKRDLQIIITLILATVISGSAVSAERTSEELLTTPGTIKMSERTYTDSALDRISHNFKVDAHQSDWMNNLKELEIPTPSDSLFAPRKNTIKLNLLSPIVKAVTVYYERDISDITSLQLGISFMDLGLTGANYSGYHIIPEFRLYPLKIKNLKAYVAPFIRFHSANIDILSFDDNGDLMAGNAKFTSFGGGMIFGGKLLVNDFAVLDVFLGPSYSKGKMDIQNGAGEHFAHFNMATELFTGLSFRAGITVGLAF